MKYIYSLLLRVVLCFLPLSLFSLILIPLTLYTSYFLLIPEGALLVGGVIKIGIYKFSIVEACVASFAFYLIWILMLLTKEISLKKRVYLILSAWGLLFVFNIIRIAFLASLAVHQGIDVFDSVHFLLWQFWSGIFVALIWISLTNVFMIKSIPIIDDIKQLMRYIRKN
jgi:exosortase/archaeosortase family protein